jgi:hypothetical protein
MNPAGPILPVALRPQGFAPSRRLAPLTASRACSIPVPLLGFHPSRLCSSVGAVRPFGRRAPLGFSSTLAGRGRPSRGSHTTRSTPAGLGIGQVAAAVASMGFPAPRFLARGSEGCSSHPPIPSRAFPARPHADLAAGASGYHLPRTQPFSLEIGEPPCSSSPRYVPWSRSCRGTHIGSGDLPNIRDRGPFVRTSALLMCRPGGLTETDPVSVK